MKVMLNPAFFWYASIVMPRSSILWELCAGRIDKGENEVAAAKRELLEETGYTAARWKRILNFYASPGFVAETMSIYLARGLRARHSAA